MGHFLLPPSLSGLSFNERKKLQSLNWKSGNISDLENRDYSFILISGQLYDDNKRFHDPAREILGIKPFFKNIKKQYFSNTIHTIIYIPTMELAKFLLESPKAMQSYILYESNAGLENLEPWKKFPRVWSVVTLQSNWQGIHFAYTIAGYLANQKNQRTAYLEFNRSGMSIFSYIDKEPRPPVMHIRDDRLPDPAMVLMERTVNVDNVDIINIQYLSQWGISYDQWVTFYNTLAQKYDQIVIHCGEDLDTFLYEDSDGLFVLRKGKTMGFGALHPSENNILWPPSMEIFTTSLPSAKDGEVKYPLFMKGVIDLKNIPFYRNLDEKYWEWFEKYPAKILNREKAIILGESSPSIIDPDNYLKTVLAEDQSFDDFLGKNMVINEGVSGVFAGLKSIERYNLKTIKKMFKKIKPVYPQSGFYSYKSFYSMLEEFFGNTSQEFLNLNFSSYCGEAHPLHWFSHGIISENLANTVFPPYCLEPPGVVPQTRYFMASNKSRWHEHIALAFRFGFKNVDFYEFLVPSDTEPSLFAEKFILSFNTVKNYVNLSGKFTQHFHLFQNKNSE